MKSPVSTNICYAFLALLITLPPAACDLPDSGTAGTPAEPTAKVPKKKKEERPEPRKVWRWSRLTEGPTPGGDNLDTEDTRMRQLPLYYRS